MNTNCKSSSFKFKLFGKKEFGGKKKRKKTFTKGTYRPTTQKYQAEESTFNTATRLQLVFHK